MGGYSIAQADWAKDKWIEFKKEKENVNESIKLIVINSIFLKTNFYERYFAIIRLNMEHFTSNCSEQTVIFQVVVAIEYTDNISAEG